MAEGKVDHISILTSLRSAHFTLSPDSQDPFKTVHSEAMDDI